MPLAYFEGKARAEEEFGVRVAAHAMRGSMASNDAHTAPGRLAKMLSSIDTGTSQKKETRPTRFGNPVRWGAVSNPHGSTSSSFDYSGIGRDGAAI